MKQGDIELAEQMKLLFQFISSLDIERLKEFREEFEQQISQYEAIGIIDGNSYFNKCDDMKARHERIAALINLIETFHNTQEKIK